MIGFLISSKAMVKLSHLVQTILNVEYISFIKPKEPNILYHWCVSPTMRKLVLMDTVWSALSQLGMGLKYVISAILKTGQPLERGLPIIYKNLRWIYKTIKTFNLHSFNSFSVLSNRKSLVTFINVKTLILAMFISLH